MAVNIICKALRDNPWLLSCASKNQKKYSNLVCFGCSRVRLYFMQNMHSRFIAVSISLATTCCSVHGPWTAIAILPYSYRGEIMTLLRKELDNLNYIGLRRSRCCSCVSLSFCIRFYNTITASKHFQIAFAYVNSPTRPVSRTSLGFFDRTTYPLLSSR